MSGIKYQKPALSVEQQIKLLQQRGLLIPNLEFAKQCLQTVSYYRLSVYCRPYQNHEHKFNSGTSFNLIWDLYSFDKELRILILDAIERIEVAFRTAISNTMSIRYGQLWYLNKQLFKDINLAKSKFHINLIKNVQDICRNPKEDFLQHFYTKYNDKYPPSWMITECLSFGTLSLIFKNLKHMKDKNTIARVLGYHATIIESWIESLVFTRNVCAHHSRLWNRWFIYRPQLPRNLDKISAAAEHTIYEQIIIIQLLLKSICGDHSWAKKLFDLLDKYYSAPKIVMGFSDNWVEDNIWGL